MPHRSKRQTRLQFTPDPSSPPSKRDYSHSSRERLAKLRSNVIEGRQLPKRNAALLPSPDASSQDQAVEPLDGSSAPLNSNRKDDEIAFPTTKKRKFSSNPPLQTTLTPRRSSRFISPPPIHVSASSSASSSSTQQLHSVEVPSPSPFSCTRSVQAEIAPVQSSPPLPATSGWPDLGPAETSGDDDDIIVSRRTAQRRRTTKDDLAFSNNDNFAASADQDYAPVTPSKGRKSDAPDQSLRSRRRKSRREQQELLEDLEDLQDSESPQLHSSRTRVASGNKKRERRRHFIELLKRRRAGEKELTPLDMDDLETPRDIDDFACDTFQDSTISSGPGSNAYSDGPSSEDDALPQIPDLDEDEADFVVPDEEDAPLGRMGQPHPDMPLEFTCYATAKPRELFIYVIEWLVKNRIAPAFSRHDGLWSLVFTKIKGEITGLASSHLKSSAWTSPFANALNARPFLTATPVLSGDHLLRHCDACGKTNRPVKYEFVFSGAAYDHDSLEPVNPNSSSDSETGARSDPEDVASVDSKGRTLPAVDTHFFLGRYCAANAELAHRFSHWKYNLNEEVMRHLESQGVLSAEEIVRRERSKGGQRKREREAEEIVDQMKATGVIEELWKGLKADLEDARIGMEGHDRRGARGSKRIGSTQGAG